MPAQRGRHAGRDSRSRAYDRVAAPGASSIAASPFLLSLEASMTRLKAQGVHVCLSHAAGEPRSLTDQSPLGKPRIV